MSIRIDENRCTGCGRCTRVCPGNLLKTVKKDDGSKVTRITCCRDCWGCCSCLKECPHQAIAMYLGADLGGRGTQMCFARKQGLYHWIFRSAEGVSRTIEVDPKNSNKY